MKSRNDLYALGEALERAALSFVIRVGPWLGPLPTAFLVGERTKRRLHMPTLVSIAAAVTLEFLGVASAATAFRFWTYNAEKLKTEPKAPTALALSLTGLYFVAALFLTVVLDTIDGAVRVAPVAFVFLSLASVSLLALRLAHAGAFVTKEERRAARKIAKTGADDAQPSAMTPQVATELPKPVAQISDWRTIVAQANGNFAQVNAKRVAETLEERGFALPCTRTLQNWAQEARGKSEGE